MNSIQLPVKKVSVVVAAGAVAVMGVVTIAMSSSAGSGGNSSVVADTSVETTPPSAPAVPSAKPLLKSTPFKGGDWPGMGSFGEDWA